VISKRRHVPCSVKVALLHKRSLHQVFFFLQSVIRHIEKNPRNSSHIIQHDWYDTRDLCGSRTTRHELRELSVLPASASTTTTPSPRGRRPPRHASRSPTIPSQRRPVSILSTAAEKPHFAAASSSPTTLARRTMAAFIPAAASAARRHAARLTHAVARAPPLAGGLTAAAAPSRAALLRRWPAAAPAGAAAPFYTSIVAAVTEGDTAPDFTATDAGGDTFSLSSLTPGRPVILYFFPKSFTPGCTKQAAAFRDASDVMAGLNAEVVGVSGDDRQAEFKKEMGLTFKLVSDADGSLRKLYGVPSTFGILPGRVTYVINAGGTVVKTINSQLDIGSHVSEAVKALEADARV